MSPKRLFYVQVSTVISSAASSIISVIHSSSWWITAMDVAIWIVLLYIAYRSLKIRRWYIKSGLYK